MGDYVSGRFAPQVLKCYWILEHTRRDSPKHRRVEQYHIASQ